MQDEHGGARDRDDDRSRAPSRRAGRDPFERLADARQRAHREAGRQHRRQHPARHGGRDDEPDDRQQPDLREPREAGEQQRAEADRRRPDAERDRPPETGRARAAVVAGPLHEQVDRVVDRLADQRDAETERDAVDDAETERDGGEAGQGARRPSAAGRARAHGPSDRRSRAAATRARGRRSTGGAPRARSCCARRPRTPAARTARASRRRPGRRPRASPRRTRRAAHRRRVAARRCPTPRRCVSATSSACRSPGAPTTHLPSMLGRSRPAARDSARWTSSAVGSRAISGAIASPADDDSRSSVPSSAACSPAVVKRCGVTRSLSR